MDLGEYDEQRRLAPGPSRRPPQYRFLAAVACCGAASLSLAYLGQRTSLLEEEEQQPGVGRLQAKHGGMSNLQQQFPVMSRGRGVERLPASSVDFWLGMLLRLLALISLCVAVVEVRAPKFYDKFYDCLRALNLSSWRSEDDALIQELERGRPFLPSDDMFFPKKSYKVVESMESALLIVAYMAASIGIVYLNAYILKQWPFAATLTTMQMSFCSVASHLCVAAGLSDPTKVGMTAKLYVTLCVPLSLLYMAYLYGSNAVYDYLPVGYIQLLKPAQAIFVYVLLAAAGKEVVAPAPVLNLLVILGSVVVASVSQSEIAGWSTLGFALMMFSNAAYAFYLVGQQLMLNTQLGGGGNKDSATRPSSSSSSAEKVVVASASSSSSSKIGNSSSKSSSSSSSSSSSKQQQQPKKSGGAKMDSITTLYFLGPSTAACLGVLALCKEWRRPDFSFRGMPASILLGDCVVAFSLNLIQICIVGRLSALTYMMSGYLKGAMTVAISWVFFHEAVSGLEIQGYVLMLFGQLLWSLRKLRARPPANPATTQKALDPNTEDKPRATLKTNAAIAASLLVAYLVYGAAINVCALVPCGVPITTPSSA
eukprot:CAMPEP_0118891120 /NCGR_PEP_ID=MMETSP1166-20130328/1271_1 /TAXON_ID=1104430 /ORGANISM="Chrysoreinhardia sp, Strain CCMP3193" /LENGTH=594 /DNA_ID=CAMNT_0006829763 /DNA_START=1 /DNA_END=1785 /DNA_ORIENTATION=+